MFKTLLLIAILVINVLIFLKIQNQAAKPNSGELSSNDSISEDNIAEPLSDHSDETAGVSQQDRSDETTTASTGSGVTNGNMQSSMTANLMGSKQIADASSQSLLDKSHLMSETSGAEHNAINGALVGNTEAIASNPATESKLLGTNGKDGISSTASHLLEDKLDTPLHVITNVTVGGGSVDGTAKGGPSSTTIGVQSPSEAAQIG